MIYTLAQNSHVSLVASTDSSMDSSTMNVPIFNSGVRIVVAKLILWFWPGFFINLTGPSIWLTVLELVHYYWRLFACWHVIIALITWLFWLQFTPLWNYSRQIICVSCWAFHLPSSCQGHIDPFLRSCSCSETCSLNSNCRGGI